MCFITRADVCLTSDPSASRASVDLRPRVRLLVVVMLAAGLTACAQPSLVTNQTALQGPNRQKSIAFAHLHRHFTTHTRTAGRKGASYALASYYGEDTETASGEKFNPNELTAAHPTLPFGTRLRVTNVANGRSVIVRVNDRGPFVRGRAVDVSSSGMDDVKFHFRNALIDHSYTFPVHGTPKHPSCPRWVSDNGRRWSLTTALCRPNELKVALNNRIRERELVAGLYRTANILTTVVAQDQWILESCVA
jgi:rare lipoprotein A